MAEIWVMNKSAAFFKQNLQIKKTDPAYWWLVMLSSEGFFWGDDLWF